MACTQHIVCFTLTHPPHTHTYPPPPDLNSARELAFEVALQKREEERMGKKTTTVCRIRRCPRGLTGNIRGAACFKFVDLAPYLIFPSLLSLSWQCFYTPRVCSRKCRDYLFSHRRDPHHHRLGVRESAEITAQTFSTASALLWLLSVSGWARTNMCVYKYIYTVFHNDDKRHWLTHTQVSVYAYVHLKCICLHTYRGIIPSPLCWLMHHMHAYSPPYPPLNVLYFHIWSISQTQRDEQRADSGCSVNANVLKD